MVLTALLVVPPLQSLRHHSDLTLWMLVLLMPQALPLAFPVGLLVGVLCGLRGRPTTNRVRRAIVVAGLFGSVAMFGTIGWLVPAANQAYRVTIARRLGGDIRPGIAETPLPTLREHARDQKRRGNPAAARTLIISYHLRISLSAAALGFALFGFSLAALRLSRPGTVIAGAAFPLAYMTYLWELSAVPAPDTAGAAIVAAWLPNVMMIVLSVVLLSARRDRVEIDPPELRA
jgi:lipopolysaccharide export LptBFGC system permease protein LptF